MSCYTLFGLLTVGEKKYCERGQLGKDKRKMRDFQVLELGASYIRDLMVIRILRPRKQNGQHFADDIFMLIFLYE